MPGSGSVASTYATNGEVTAANLNANLVQAAITNHVPTLHDDYSADATQMRLNTSPGGVGTESLATSLAGELERIRYVIKNLLGLSQWYAVTENVNLGARTLTTTGALAAGATTVGGGTAIAKVLSATANLNFTALAANSCEEFTVTVTGAADGDVVALGIPHALASVDGGTPRTVFFGWVSAADTVTVRRANVTGTVTADPAAATVRVMVTKF